MVKNYPTKKLIFILEILLVSAAHIMRQRSDFVPIKMLLHEKVLSIVKNMIGDCDGDSLLALMYLAIYESLDPEVGKTIWKTLSLACNKAEKLHLTSLQNSTSLPGVTVKLVPKQRLLSVLYKLEISTSITLGRPPSIVLTCKQIEEYIYDTQLKNELLIETTLLGTLSSIYDNTTNCPILKLTSQPPTDPRVYVLSAQLLSHECSECNGQKETFVNNLLAKSLELLEIENISLKSYHAINYWSCLSNVSIATISLLICKKLWPQLIRDDTELNLSILLGQKLVSLLCSGWFQGWHVRNFIDLCVDACFPNATAKR
ncbi:unnamed protein product [Ambrosiozyma monospora]|uniref:Unnamed protein product n=1 Tax=Ambrosiozyma monospora TaxID=43982 RepID=A0ACB5T7U8_AMBMO|nr:unnamed protein product [Ambrosiozyma monospora]